MKTTLFACLLLLAGCATTPRSPVSVHLAAPVGATPQVTAVTVQPEPGEVDWAAEQALRGVGVAVAPDSYWRLRASERTFTQVREHPFACNGPGWGPYWGRYDAWYWRDPWCSQRVLLRQKRLITWILEDTAGQVFWRASAWEGSMEGLPLEASRHLASSLAQWQAQAARLP